MPARITTLIDKLDGFEIVRDQIASILAVEQANQQVLAEQAGKDPLLWKLRVFTERSNPWQEFEAPKEFETSPLAQSPIVNVWYSTSTFNGSASNVVERQRSESVFNIDCYGCGVATESSAGHDAGDELAAREAQRCVRLVRNILMAGASTYLGLRGLVGKRWPQSVTMFQPELEAANALQVQAARIAFQVDFNEFSPQVEGQPLELVSVEVKRSPSGELLLRADYPV